MDDELSAAVKVRLLATLAQIDAQLDEAEQSVHLPSLHSPLARRMADVTPLQQQLIAEGAQHLRDAMRKVLQRHGIAPPAPNASAAHDCHAVLNRALAIIAELGPGHISLDDTLSDEAESELRRIVAQLLEPLDNMQRALSVAEASPQAGGGDLGELRRIVDRHGLTALQAPLSALAQRVQMGDFMIAVFGRVNAGKSSLLNHLLGSPVLPVGVTPATVVPVLLRHGHRARGLAEFADAAPDLFTPGRLAEFAAEQYNPGNARHVTRLMMELPAPRLEGGITLLDMPGLSSDAAASLPPCDLGIVLVDAAGDLSLDECELADALLRAATQVIVLLSKADRLDDEGRWKVYGHVAERLRAHTGVELPLYFASSVGGDASLRDDWIERGLQPLLARRRSLVEASLRRKTQAVHEAAIEALHQRLSEPQRDESADAIETGLAQGRALLAQAGSQRVVGGDEPDRQAHRLLDEVVYNAAVLGSFDSSDELDLTPLLAASLQARAAAIAKDLVRELRILAARCDDALAAAGAHTVQPLSVARPSAFDPGWTLAVTVLHKPWFAPLGRWSVRWAVRRALRQRGLRENITRQLAAYVQTLVEWRITALTQLERDMDAAIDQLRGEADLIEQDLETLRRQ